MFGQTASDYIDTAIENGNVIHEKTHEGVSFYVIKPDDGDSIMIMYRDNPNNCGIVGFYDSMDAAMAIFDRIGG